MAEWNIAFRLLDNFPHPNLRVQCGKVPLPRLFENFPEAKDDIIKFAVKNLTTLTIESVHDFVINNVVPKLFELWKKEEMDSSNWKDDSEFLTTEMFLRDHGIISIGVTMVWQWMQDLGFSYDMRKKNFYIDGHERDDVVEHRLSFSTKYLTKYEPRCQRWMQLPREEALLIEGVNIEFGYSYINPTTNIELREFHDDYCHTISGLQEKAACMSVRAPPGSKPLMMLRQD